MTEPVAAAVARPGVKSRTVLGLLWLALGLIMVGTVVWLAVTRRDPLLHGHPVTLVLVFGCLLIGLVAVIWALPTLITLARYGERRDHLTDAQLRFRARGRLGLAVPLLAISTLLVASLIYARPFAATDTAVAAMRTTDAVRVVERLTWYELVPAAVDADDQPIEPTTALIFVPGARVDARAYAAVLRPLAQQGILVCVVKEPLGLSVLDPGQAGTVIANHPKITTWVVGGHSLGGATVSRFAQEDPRVAGLVLYASYPIGVVDRPGLQVLSVSGGNDHLATPTDIEAAKGDLPADTQYLTVAGGVHAYFGDYGEQPGDGVPNVDRAEAQRQISAATALFIKALAAGR